MFCALLQALPPFTLIPYVCWRPYHVECTGSLLTSEVKRHRARLVLGWGTAWEDLRVLPAQSDPGGQEQEAGGEREWGKGKGEGEGEGEEAEAEAEASWPLPLSLPLFHLLVKVVIFLCCGVNLSLDGVV